MSAHNGGSPVIDDTIPLGDHDQIPATGDGFVPAGELLTLSLEDLIPDVRGEVVILSDTGLDIAVVTTEPVASQGVETLHVMDSGLDVSGFGYCTFVGGITVFYPPTHRLLVTDET